MVVRGRFQVHAQSDFKVVRDAPPKPRQGESPQEEMERVRETYTKPRATFYDKDARKIRKTAW